MKIKLCDFLISHIDLIHNTTRISKHFHYDLMNEKIFKKLGICKLFHINSLR